MTTVATKIIASKTTDDLILDGKDLGEELKGCAEEGVEISTTLDGKGFGAVRKQRR